MKETTKGYLAMTVHALIVGLSYMSVKIALGSAAPLDLLAHRFTVAAAAVLIARAFMPGRQRIKKKDVLKIAPLSLAFPLLFFLFQAFGMLFVSSSEVGIICASIPVITLIIGRIVLGESISRMQLVFMLLSIGGVVFINMMNGLNVGEAALLGFFLILLSAVCSAFYNVFGRKLSGSYSAFSITTVITLVAFGGFNLVAIVQHAAAGTLGSFFAPFGELSFLLAVVFLGVMSSLITALLSIYSLGKLEAATVGQFNNVSTVVSILAGVFFLQEPLTYYHYIGILAILLGTSGFNYLKRGRA